MNTDSMYEYQAATTRTAIYPGAGQLEGLMYAALGLASEAGEVSGVVKKVWRDGKDRWAPETRDKLARELGDVLWYVSQVANELELPLEVVAQMNLNKLADRQERGAISGSGDNR